MRLLPVLLLASAVAAQDTGCAFDGGGTGYKASTFRSVPGPKVEDDALTLTNGWMARAPLSNAIAFDRTAAGAYKKIKARFTFTLTKGAHGGGFVLLDTKQH